MIVTDDGRGFRARRNVGVLGLMLIAGMWLGVGVLAWRDHSTALKSVEESQRADLAVTRAYAGLVVDVAQQAMRQIQARAELLSWDAIQGDEQLQRTAESLSTGLRRQVTGIYMLDASGQIRLSSRMRVVPPGESRADRDYFLALGAGWSGPYFEPANGRISGGRVMVVAFPFNDIVGAFRGGILVSISIDALDTFFTDATGSAGTRMILTRKDGKIVYDSRSEVLRTDRDDPLFPTMQSRSAGTIAFDDERSGTPIRADFSAVENSGLFLRIEKDIGAVLRDWRTETARNVVFALVLTAFTAAFVMRNRRLIQVLDEERRLRTGSETALIQRVGEIEAARSELDAARALAVRANAAKTEFLASMSHEIRTPMNGVLGFIDLLRRTKLDRTQSGYLARVIEASKSLQSILDEVLDFSKLEAGELRIITEPFDIVDLVESIVAWGQVQAEHRGVSVAGTLQPAIPRTLVGDGHRLKQILMNLMSNALKFTHEGSIIIDVRETVRGPEMIELRFLVKDTGDGIEDENIEKLFNPFSQVGDDAARHREGTGLGLSICRKLVEMQGGRIGVTSSAGRGSTFWFDLEFHLGAELAPAKTGAKRPATLKKRKTGVLVVDDLDMNRELVSIILTSAGYAVDEAETGPRALQKAAKTAYDLVFMDVQLGDMDGLEVTRLMRKMGGHWADAPIIGLSASVFPEQVARCLEAGMTDFVAKPIDAEVLLEKAAKATGAAAPAANAPTDASA